MHRFLFTAFMLAALPLAAAGQNAFTSKPTRTHLIELFTSEGCSSCPPAEAWLSKLKNTPGLWTDFVPLAFHVDYWDRLGWRDPFASKEWTARQYRYSASWKSTSVYTPGFVLDGREWRNSGVPPASSETPGVLSIALNNSNRVTASFHPAKADARSFDVHVARLGFDLKINVKAGENSSRQLLHDFVVLAVSDARLTTGETEVKLPSNPDAPGRQAIVAWVTEAGSMEPLQTVGGWLQP